MTTSASPFFTVVVPTYNHEKFLPEALDSLLGQSFEDWEAVVVDDGSTDGSGEIMDHYAKRDPRIRTIHKANGGVSSALNAGIENARGEWICWLSSDDYFEPGKLRSHRKEIRKYPAIKFFFTGFIELNEETGEKKNSFYIAPQGVYRVVRFFSGNYVNGISVVVHRSVFRSAGKFREEFRNAQDFDMWLRISAMYMSRYILRRTCVTRVHAKQGTRVQAEAGAFDSAFSCWQFLNSHAYAEIFPSMDLQNPIQATRAFVKTLRITLSPGSVMHAFGFNPMLLRRFREWWGMEHPPSVKIMLGLVLRSRFWRYLYPGLESQVRREIEGPACRDRGMEYQPSDVLTRARCHAEELARSGRVEESQALFRYLERFGTDGVEGKDR
jgi:cellulose synthase/poly-beta-1,6-N-acetylglucosamine synthase-like glycosyltransferase